MIKSNFKKYISLLLKEDFQLPPRNIILFLEKIVPPKINKFRSIAKNVLTIFNSNNEELISDFLRSVNLNKSDFDYRLKERDHYDDLKYVQSTLEAFKTDKRRAVINYILNGANRFTEREMFGLEELDKEIQINKEKIIEEAEYYKEISMKYYEQEFPENLINSLFSLSNEILNLKKVIQDLINKLEAWLHTTTPNYYSGEDTRPKHENIEFLYHTSINAKNIFTNGFLKEIPEKGGLGGSQTTKSGGKGISFTADLYDAKEIARSLKEVIGIANRKYDFRDVLSWALMDGVSEDKILGDYKISRKQDEFEKETAKLFKRKPDFSYRQSLSNPKIVFELYKRYLTFSQKRYNPLYFGVSINSFVGLDEANVGIVKAKVDMTNSDIGYFSGMKEFRVPVDAIIEIAGFIGERNA